MVYISEDGRVLESNPWSFSKIYSLFAGFFFMILMFFRTLINPDITKHGDQYSRDYRPGSGPPRPPSRRIGRPYTGETHNVPGGCRSCARQ
ncbi:selenoprotein K [Cephus cinctus]|uniref:Selenoprotein K n=1 Tax=Cephus cinctus TaxID=211228 RepID=A0AAJ7FT67_CEPCN|nr:selenoprotein K [Cephus cinctus]